MTVIKFDGTSYNADWIKSHSEAQFVAKCATQYPHLSEAKVKELYSLVNPKTKEDGNGSGDVKASKKR